MKTQYTAQTYKVTIDINGVERWYVNDELHRWDGPAVIYPNGDKEWWQTGDRHRIGGPAHEMPGYQAWYINGKLHRLDGPAVVDLRAGEDYKAWLVDNEYHRLDGPARVWGGKCVWDGKCHAWLYHKSEWYINGLLMPSKDEFNKEIARREHAERVANDPCHGTIVEVAGKKYKLQAV